MQGMDLYQGVALIIAQFVLILGAIWGMISYRFNALETNMNKRFEATEALFNEKLISLDKAFMERVVSIRQLYESDLRGLSHQLKEVRVDVENRGEVFSNALKNCVSLGVCLTRKEYEDRMFVMFEKSLDGISKKLDFAVDNQSRRHEERGQTGN